MISKIKTIAVASVLLLSIVFISCSNNNSKKIAYQCPMQCQSDTAYTSEGICPVCEMKLNSVDISKDLIIIKNQ